jgi:2-oxo-hept-3-ene-1,7-dioate hydratase
VTSSEDTSLTIEQITTEAGLLDHAEQTATQMRQTTTQYPDMTMADAYTIQNEWLRLKLSRGETLVGHKIGLTSRAMQAAMNITTPDSGFLTNTMVFEPNIELHAADFCDPKLEVELSFSLAHDLSGPDLSVDDVLDATDFVSPAVELIAARSYRRDPDTGRTRTVLDTISDNAADAGIVSGTTRVSPREVDLQWVAALAYRNGTIEETGVAAGVLGHPARGIVWLARRYHEQGLTLEAGQTILSGSFTRPIDIRPGDHFQFDYGPLDSFELSFT